jgi:hypothetical protein
MTKEQIVSKLVKLIKDDGMFLEIAHIIDPRKRTNKRFGYAAKYITVKDNELVYTIDDLSASMFWKVKSLSKDELELLLKQAENLHEY